MNKLLVTGIIMVFAACGSTKQAVNYETIPDKNSKIFFAQDNFHCDLIGEKNEGQKFYVKKNNVPEFPELTIELKGNYQDKNICTVLQAIEVLKNEFEKYFAIRRLHTYNKTIY